MNKSATTQEIFNALTLAQSEMPVVKMNSTNPFLKNKYADLGAVIEASRPILAKHLLAILQTPVSDGDKIGVTTMLVHKSGEWVEDTIFINASDGKGLSSAQNAGVTISYLRRYSWASILGLYADEDTDGHKPTPPTTTKVPMTLDEAKKYKDSKNIAYADKTVEELNKIVASQDAPEDKKNAARVLIADKKAGK
jgi:hypothetical protein